MRSVVASAVLVTAAHGLAVSRSVSRDARLDPSVGVQATAALQEGSDSAASLQEGSGSAASFAVTVPYFLDKDSIGSDAWFGGPKYSPSSKIKKVVVEEPAPTVTTDLLEDTDLLEVSTMAKWDKTSGKRWKGPSNGDHCKSTYLLESLGPSECPGTTTTKVNFQDCAVRCIVLPSKFGAEVTEKCVGFDFHKDGGYCYLYKATTTSTATVADALFDHYESQGKKGGAACDDNNNTNANGECASNVCRDNVCVDACAANNSCKRGQFCSEDIQCAEGEGVCHPTLRDCGDLVRPPVTKNSPTSMDSIWSGCSWDGSVALDGNRRTDYGSNSCTHTDATAQPWWRVDMGSEKAVGDVTVFTRSDCCPDRSYGWKFKVSNNPIGGKGDRTLDIACIPTNIDSVDHKYNVKCEGATGRYFEIWGRPSHYMTVCEVVFEQTGMKTYLLNKAMVTTQKSTGWSMSSSNAIDGFLSGNWNDSSCYCSGGTDNEWWRVDMGAVKNVAQIMVNTRSDCCPERSNNWSVRVTDNPAGGFDDGTLCNTPSTPNAESGLPRLNVVCADGTKGRYIEIRGQKDNYLTICEVRAFGPTDK